ncbi:MAG: hypothetical protein RSE00_04270 [Clostridia bacterium]
MDKKQKYMNWATTLLQAIIFFALGIFILRSTNTFLGFVVYGVSFGFIGVGLLQTIKNIFYKTEKILPVNFVYSLGNILVGAFILYKPEMFVDIFPLLLTFYVLIDAVVKTITFILYRNNDIKPRFSILIKCLISYIFFFILIFHPLFRGQVTYIIVGIYFILFGITYLFDSIDSLIPVEKKREIKKRVRITLPVFIAAFIPKKALEEINEVFNDNDENRVKIVKQNIEPDIEVFVHIGRKGFGSFGHVDLYFDERVISYGSYDEANIVLFSAIGDGVLFETNKNKYMDFCNEHVEKTLVGFGLKLTNTQKEAIRTKLDEIKSVTYPWEPEAKLHPEKEYTDYASRLYKATDAKFWKFTGSKFKTYFALNTNCVLLADQLIGASGIDILKISGIITPGTYYDYFNREFERQNSIVVSKNIYKEDMKSKIQEDKNKD